MILIMLSLLLALIFAVISVFHFYWFFGGAWGAKHVIPSTNNSSKKVAIPKFVTLLVAIVFVGFSLVYLLKADLIIVEAPSFILDYGYWFISIIFIARAIGEFRFVGFFKKIKHTDFSKADSKIFSPLCIAIGIIGIVIQMIAKSWL